MMQTVLFLTPDLEPCGATTQLRLLASGLPADRFRRTVCVLGRPDDAASDLRASGAEVTALGWQRLVDLPAFDRLRTLLSEHRPDVIHAWRLPALWVGALLRRWKGGRLVVSAPLSPGGGRGGFVSRWLLRRADRVVAADRGEAERLRRLGVPDERLAVVPPGVEPPQRHGGRTPRALGLPDEARMVLVIGPLERYKGGYEAVWAFDMLGQLVPDLHLVLAGEGAEIPRLRRFAAQLRGGSRVHFVGRQRELAPLLAEAEVVWAPVRADAGRCAVLEAMAAGVPVVASRVPAMEEIVADGETGILVAPGDKAALSRQTRLLLDDAQRRRQVGDAGRRRAAEQFTAAAVREAYIRLYEGAGERGTVRGVVGLGGNQ
jgi:glycosyltransferase involved in cell wall biosynthesis